MNRAAVADRLRRYDEWTQRAPARAALTAALLVGAGVYVAVAVVVAVDLRPKGRAAAWIARRIQC